jgi:peptide subunit release factor 1 (eRF1)
MSKIQELIAAKKILPKDCLYHTQRGSRNSKGEYTGSIRVLALKEDNIARVEYKCPECGHEGYAEQEWKRPFAIKCEKCGAKLGVPKMREEFKKEQKKANKK